MGKLKKCLFLLIIPFLGLLSVKADSEEFNFNASTIGGKKVGSSENFIPLPKDQFNTVSMNLTLNYYYYYGYVNQPIKDNELVNVLFVSCTNPLHPIVGLYSSKKNFLDLNYVSDEKCAWSWENEPTGRVQYTFARLKYDSVQLDELDSEDGSITNWYYKFNTQSFGIQGLSYDSSIYFTSISYLTSSEYNDMLAQYRALAAQKNTDSKIDNANSKLDEAENTRKGIWETIKSIPGLILDGFKSLFIPEDMSFLDDFKESISNKLGFIAQIPISVIDFGIDLVNLDVEEMTSVTFPTVEIMGVHFWPEMDVDITPIMSKFGSFKYLTDVLCVTLCVYTLNRWREKFTGGGETK